jgi:hypothetical protein
LALAFAATRRSTRRRPKSAASGNQLNTRECSRFGTLKICVFSSFMRQVGHCKPSQESDKRPAQNFQASQTRFSCAYRALFVDPRGDAAGAEHMTAPARLHSTKREILAADSAKQRRRKGIREQQTRQQNFLVVNGAVPGEHGPSQLFAAHGALLADVCTAQIRTSQGGFVATNSSRREGRQEDDEYEPRYRCRRES